LPQRGLIALPLLGMSGGHDLGVRRHRAGGVDPRRQFESTHSISHFEIWTHRQEARQRVRQESARWQLAKALLEDVARFAESSQRNEHSRRPETGIFTWWLQLGSSSVVNQGVFQITISPMSLGELEADNGIFRFELSRESQMLKRLRQFPSIRQQHSEIEQCRRISSCNLERLLVLLDRLVHIPHLA
jgi:hypothetical protein